MSILLLIAAVLFWLVAAVPGFIQIKIGWIDFGWAGNFLFGLWLLVGGAGTLLAFVRRPAT